MSVTYRIDRTKRIIFTKCDGNVIPYEVSEHFQELERDPECPDRLNVLLDLSEMTSIPASEQLRVVSDQIGRIRGKVRFEYCAVVAVTDVLYGMSRMFQVFAEKWFREILVFSSRDEAEAWLGRRPGRS
jgi:hypothetical protein